MDVKVTRQYKGTSNLIMGSALTVGKKVSPVNSTSTNISGEVGEAVSSGKMVTIPFFNTLTPNVADYNTIYASVYGQNPIIRIFVTNSANENKIELKVAPTKYITDDLIQSIQWDLPLACSGEIILNN